MPSTFFRATRKFIDILLLAISPLMFIGVLVALIALVTRHSEHRQFVRRMNESSLVTQGTVESASPENDWVFVRYLDEAGETRQGVLGMFYYDDPALWASLTPDAEVTVRYLPWRIPGNDRLVLAERYAEVRGYRGYFSFDVIGLLLVCWVLVIIKPQFLYIGLVDADLLFTNGLTQ